MEEKEIWKDIHGYEGLYQVNQWGDIYSLYTNKKLSRACRGFDKGHMCHGYKWRYIE